MIKEYWYNLNKREQILASLGLVVCLLYLFYLLIYSPLKNKADFSNQQLAEKSETLAWMQQNQGLKVSKKKEQASNSNLLSIIANQLNSSKFKKFTYQLQQTGSGDIQLSFEEVPFNQFLSWFLSFQESYEIQLRQFSADKTETPGVAKVTVIFSGKI